MEIKNINTYIKEKEMMFESDLVDLVQKYRKDIVDNCNLDIYVDIETIYNNIDPIDMSYKIKFKI